ncbi:MAG: STAS domain-containing protein [Gemmatimonadales bacterium]|nr:STAS domain-containing protein [Gemmatimonadales bacterium]
MFEIIRDEKGTVFLSGRLDAASCAEARDLLDEIHESCLIDFSSLDYIASAGLGLLVSVQRRLMAKEAGLSFRGLSPHLNDVLTLAGFEGIFDFE